jgi:hypothetical protein
MSEQEERAAKRDFADQLLDVRDLLSQASGEPIPLPCDDRQFAKLTIGKLLRVVNAARRCCAQQPASYAENQQEAYNWSELYAALNEVP